MVDYLNSSLKRRNGGGVMSSVMYIVMNVALAVVTVLVTAVTGTWIFGLLIALLSKWRVFAVSPRHWWVNIKANMVDFIVRISFVMITYYIGVDIRVEDLVIVALFVIWLLFVKPRTSEKATELQALSAVFLGTVATTWGVVILEDAGLSFEACASIVMVAGFLVGYAGLRHIVAQSEDFEFSLPTLVWGLMSAQVAWIMFHRIIIYYVEGFAIPQVAIILTLVNYVFYRLYGSVVKHGGRVDWKEIAGPVIFVVVMIFVMLVWFSGQRLRF